MIQGKSHLFLKRLVVITQKGTIAFDEVFHHGVNIIRGLNSSGKSTISNFIFFVLGGDYNSWTAEARKCKDVFAEVEINGAIITLKRHISESGQQPMSVFWNNYEEAIKDGINWQTFPYKQNSDNFSFTNIIFTALEFPSVKNDSDSNITMHQILRLLYIDQDTPAQNLFRFERFDLPLTRQAISEVLLGIYDDILYNQRLNLRNTQKDYDDKKKQYDGINKVYGQSENRTNLSSLQNDIESTQSELVRIDNAILALKELKILRTSKKSATNSEKIQTELIIAKNNIRDIKTSLNQYEIEIADSKQFIETLEKRVVELDYSLLTRKVLGELPLTHCPQCLSPLQNHVEIGHCLLCKQPLIEETVKANAKRLKQEMEMQIKESKSLLEEKERILFDFRSNMPILIEKARMLQKQLDSSIEVSQTTRDEKIDTLLISKGGIEKKIEFLTMQLKTAEMLEHLKQELTKLNTDIEHLKLEISQKESQQKNNYANALNKIKESVLNILNNDLDRQEEFKSGKIVDVNFHKDAYSLDGSNNFSASSKIYFKNAVLFSIFFASLELEYFRYPRFILCDNMEDKGMEKERSQNFQKLITLISENHKEEHQIIFTTSMIANELDNTPYCVGNNYDKENKTLKIQ